MKVNSHKERPRSIYLGSKNLRLGSTDQEERETVPHPICPSRQRRWESRLFLQNPQQSSQMQATILALDEQRSTFLEVGAWGNLIQAGKQEFSRIVEAASVPRTSLKPLWLGWEPWPREFSEKIQV